MVPVSALKLSQGQLNVESPGVCVYPCVSQAMANCGEGKISKSNTWLCSVVFNIRYDEWNAQKSSEVGEDVQHLLVVAVGVAV